ncbi:MAG: hypothetical protein KA368_05605 [Acidobacteria bacterium]|nr:hypothetical protein [Acidobacteriota bacterium]
MAIFQDIPVNGGGETIRAAQREIINRANANHLTADGWSLAELRTDDSDFEWLQNWAHALDEEIASRWLLPGQTAAFWGNPQTRRAGIGVLVMMLAAEQKRRGLVGDDDWIAVLSSLFSDQTRPILFKEGSFAPPLIGSMKEASMRLRLRVGQGWDSFAAQREGIALQVGLTEPDLAEQFPQWLKTLDIPEHISALLDPVNGSDSFLHLWQGCRDYLQGFVNETDLRETLETNVWILPRWVNTMVAALKPLRQEPAEPEPALKPASTGPLVQIPSEPEDVFGAFMPYGGIKTIIRATCAILERADKLGFGGIPWSLSDLKITDYDYAWLRIWVMRLEPDAVNLIAQTERQFKAGEADVSVRAALGTMLGLWISETVRRGENGTDEIWHFLEDECFQPAVSAEFFRQNQPSSFLRVLLSDAARELNLKDTLTAAM